MSQMSSPVATTTTPGNTRAIVLLALGLAALSCVILKSETTTTEDATSATELQAPNQWNLLVDGRPTDGIYSWTGGKHGEPCGFDPGDDKVKCTYKNENRRRRNLTGTTTQFHLKTWGSEYGMFSVKAGKWCSLHHDGTEIKCKETNMQDNHQTGKFDLRDIGDGRFKLMGHKRGNPRHQFPPKKTHYWRVCSDRGNDGVKCNHNSVDTWEQFNVLMKY
jgi:hypothetical protein